MAKRRIVTEDNFDTLLLVKMSKSFFSDKGDFVTEKYKGIEKATGRILNFDEIQHLSNSHKTLHEIMRPHPSINGIFSLPEELVKSSKLHISYAENWCCVVRFLRKMADKNGKEFIEANDLIVRIGPIELTSSPENYTHDIYFCEDKATVKKKMEKAINNIDKWLKE